MFAYNLRLALLSLGKTPGLSALMIGAVALGIGVCMTTLSVYTLMSGNPIEHKSERLFAVQLDNWNPDQPYAEPNEPPLQLTWKDTKALAERSPEGVRRVPMLSTGFVVERPDTEDVRPEIVNARATTPMFFSMFETPFLYGGPWDEASGSNGAQVMVLSKELNQTLFAGEDSVGKELRVGELLFRVVGVLDEWNPTPRFYDLNVGAFNPSDQLYIPLGVWEPRAQQWGINGSVNCWQAPPAEGIVHSECVFTQFWVELPDAAAKADYQAFLDAYVSEQKKLGRFPRPLNNRLSDVEQWLDVNEVVADDNTVLVGLSFMFLAVCLLNTVGLLLAKFLGRAGQIGVRRALGANKRTIFQQHLVEVGVLGLIGGVLGLGLAWLGLAGVRELYGNFERVAHLNGELVLLTLGLSLVAGLAAGLYPAWAICRIPPATYLKTQ
jgi:putative ABC transport system permease protein